MDVDALRDSLAHFHDLPDPRAANRRHLLSDIVAITILAVLASADDWPEIEAWARARHTWLATFLHLPHGIPSHDTFDRVLAALDPAAFERGFLKWTSAIRQASGGRIIAMDGKTLRRSFDHASGRAAIHMVSAWCEQNHLVLGQLTTDDKSNEITAVPKLLALLDVQGATVTLDAMHCQKKTADQIVEQGGHYLLQVKKNQRTLHEEIELFFDEALARGFEHMAYAKVRDVDAGHGRIETRTLYSTWDIDWFRDKKHWRGLGSFVCVESVRDTGEKTSKERRYYLSSHDGRDASALLEAVRGHWGIENRVHWLLDVSFGEDHSRLRKGHGAENFSRVRRLVLNLLRHLPGPKPKTSIKTKRLLCACDLDYLIKALTFNG